MKFTRGYENIENIALLFRRAPTGTNEFYFERPVAMRKDRSRSYFYGEKNYQQFYGQKEYEKMEIYKLKYEKKDEEIDKLEEIQNTTDEYSLNFERTSYDNNTELGQKDTILVILPDYIKSKLFFDSDERPNSFTFNAKMVQYADRLGKKMNRIVYKDGKYIGITNDKIIPETDFGSPDFLKALELAMGCTPVKAEAINNNQSASKPEEKKAPKNDEEQKNSKNDQGKIKLSESIDYDELVNYIKQYVVDQDTAIEDIVGTVMMNQKIYENPDMDLKISSILVDGPTGTGKTFIIENLCKKIGIPFVYYNAVRFSTEGYKGKNVSTIAEDLLKLTKGNVELAERAIVILDEFDKLGQSVNDTGNDMRTGIQDELLTVVSGEKRDVRYDGEDVPLDTSKMTFICMGAFTDLRERKIKEHEKEIKGGIGFGSPNKENVEREYTLLADDYVEAGLKRELVGRLTTVTYTNALTKNSLKKILTESKSSPLEDIKKKASLWNTEVEISDEVVDEIVDQAYTLKTGARGLTNVCDSLTNVINSSILRKNVSKVTIDKETLDKTMARTKRKYDADEGRGR